VSGFSRTNRFVRAVSRSRCLLTDATYLIDPTLRKEFQTIPLRAVGNTGQLEWTVDGRRLVQGSSPTISWPLERGTHVVRARDAGGQIAQVRDRREVTAGAGA
jgi:hypothetical protein